MRAVASVILVPLLLTVVSIGMAWATTGASLGLFIGGLMFVTILAPPLTMAQVLSARRLWVLLAVTVPWWMIWAATIPMAQVRVVEWLGCCIVLLAHAGALMALTAIFRWIGCAAVIASALAVVVGLAWMTWPIWLSPTWNGDQSENGVARLVVCHPGFAINGRLVRGTMGSWTEQPIAYHLTDLNQTVVYSLPTSIWPCVLLHGIFAGAVLACGLMKERRRGATPLAASAVIA